MEIVETQPKRLSVDPSVKDTESEIEIKVSYFEKHFHKNSRVVSLNDVLGQIKNGTHESILRIREFHNNGLENEAKKLKSELPAFTPCGVFGDSRKVESLSEYSGLIVLDFDHLDDAEELRDSMADDEFTYSVFLSPRGEGVKVLVKVSSDENSHKVAFDQVASYYEEKFGLERDKSGSDLTRLT